MTLWTVARMDLDTTGPILGQYHWTVQMEDRDDPGKYKYESNTISASQFNAEPTALLGWLQSLGYTPNDFGLVVE